MVKKKKIKITNKAIKTISKTGNEVYYDVGRVVKDVPKGFAGVSKEYSITTFLRGEKKLIPFLRIEGEMDEDIRTRQYHFMGAIPPAASTLRLKDMMTILEDNAGVINGVVLFDSITKVILELTYEEIKKAVNFKRKGR